MTRPTDDEAPRTLPRVGVSSFKDKAQHAWVEAEPADPSRSNRAGAAVHTPETEQNRSGPRAELKPDPPLVTSLAMLAATLGIPLIAGERLIDANDSGAGDGYAQPEHTDPGVFTDPDDA